MATTKKSTKGRKKSRKYMKRAARRTLAALLMITALIVAAIPATPGAAQGSTGPNATAGIRSQIIADPDKYYAYEAPDGKTLYYFEKITNEGVDNAIIFIGFDSLNDDKSIKENADITDISFDKTIPIKVKEKTLSDDGITEIETEVTKNFECVAIKAEVANYDKIRKFECPTVTDVYPGLAGSDTVSNNTLEEFICSRAKVIANGAFNNCTKLSKVNIGGDLVGETTKIENNAFFNCVSLSEFRGPNTNEIGDRAFFNCISMENCEVNSDIKSIGSEAFKNSALKYFPDFKISNSIGSDAFYGTKLTAINITGPGLEEGKQVALSSGIFKECKDLTSVDFDGAFNTLGAETFYGCEILAHVKLADSMTSIGNNSFFHCYMLNNLTIPAKITGGNLPVNLLNDCQKLTTLTLKNEAYDDSDIIIDNIFNSAWLKSPSCNLIVEGYRYYQPEKGSKGKSLAYLFCINHNIPYKCLDADEGWADKYFDVDGSGKLLYVDIADYFGEDNPHVEYHVDIPQTVHGIPINKIGSDAFIDVTNNVKSISVSSPNVSVEPGAFNINGLTYVRFAPKSQTVIDDSDGVFPSDDFYIYGDIVTDDKDTLNALEYATKYGVEYRGDGTYQDDPLSSPITLIIMPEISSLTKEKKATVVAAISKDKPAPGANYDSYVGKEKLKSLSEAGANIYLPSGVSSITDDFLKEDIYLRKIKTDGLTELKPYQFQSCVAIDSVDIGGAFGETTVGALPFRSASVNAITINDKNGIYSVDKYGVIYGNGGTTIIEGIENSIQANGENTRYDVPSSVRRIEDSAFEDNRWISLFSTVYDNNDDYKSNVNTIPKRAFFNASELSRVILGACEEGDGYLYVKDGAFNYDKAKLANNDMRLDVYSPDVSYATTAFADSSRRYNFYSDEGDSTYRMCEVLEDDRYNNLIWHKRDDTAKTSLANYEIYFPKNNGKYPYSDDPYTFVVGMNDDVDSADCSDIIVRNKQTKAFLDPKYYTVVSNIVNISGSKEVDTRVPVTIFGNSESGYSGNLYRDIIIQKKEGSGSGELSKYDIEFVNGDKLKYTGEDIPIIALDSKDGTGEPGEFYVWNRESGEILKNLEQYTYEPKFVQDKGTYVLIVTGASKKFAGEQISRVFEVYGKDDPDHGKTRLSRIEFPEAAGGQTRYYDDGYKYNFIAGLDYVVYGTDDKVVDPSEYELVDGNLTDVVGDPTSTKEVRFTVSTNASSTYAKSSVGNKFIIKPQRENEGPFSIRLPGIDELGFAEWTGSVIEPEPIVLKRNDASSPLDVNIDYTVGYPNTDAASGPNNRDMGLNKGAVYVYGIKEPYKGETGTRFFHIRKNIPYYVNSDDSRKKISFTVTNGKYYDGSGTTETKIDNDTRKSEETEKYASGRVSATVELVDATTGKKLVEGVDYTLSFKKEKGMNGTVTVTGMGNYFGSYTSAKFPLKKESKSSSSSSGGGSSSNSSSNKSSSSSSSRSSSSSMGGSSSSSGTGSSSGANRNSGTTVINRNYYGPNGGTVDELQDMLRAAHIDSINGGTADGYQVNITKSDAAEQAFRDALIRRYGSLDNIRYFSMDISVRDQNGNPIDTSGMSVTLTLPLPTSMQQYGTNNKIATVDSGGDLEDLNEQFSTLEGRPCVTFVAPHFSPYGFYVNTADLAIGTLDNTPKTGDPIHPKWFLSFGLAALSIFLFLKRDPKPRVSAA